MPTIPYGSCIYGTDFSIPPHLLLQGMLADSRNIVPTASGLPTGRNGTTKLSTTPTSSRITSLHEFRSGTTRYTLMSYGTKVTYYNSTTGVFEDVITGLTTGKHLQWINFGGKAICVNEGADTPQWFSDPTTIGTIGAAPKGNCICEWQNRVFYGGDSTNVALLSGSDLNDPLNHTAGGSATGRISQYVGDSKDPIMGLAGFFDLLLIGKRNNLYKLSGAPATDASTIRIDPVYSKADDNIGFTSPWAISQIGNDLIFLDGYDIKALTGIQAYGDVETTSIIPHFKDFLKDTIDQNYLKYTQFFHYKQGQQLWVSIPTGATTHYVFALDYRFKKETTRYAFYPMSYAFQIICLNGVENGEVLDMYCGDETGYVRKLDAGNDDDGSAIERYMVFPFSGNDPANGVTSAHELRKQWQYSETFILPSAVTLGMTPSYAVNLMNDSQVRTSGNYIALPAENAVDATWQGTGIKAKRTPRLFGVNGNTLMLKWLHQTVAQNFTFYPSTMHYSMKSSNRII